MQTQVGRVEEEKSFDHGLHYDVRGDGKAVTATGLNDEIQFMLHDWQDNSWTAPIVLKAILLHVWNRDEESLGQIEIVITCANVLLTGLQNNSRLSLIHFSLFGWKQMKLHCCWDAKDR